MGRRWCELVPQFLVRVIKRKLRTKTMQFHETKISFIGAGNMASAIIEGLLEKGLAPENIMASDPSQDKLDAMAQKLGIKVSMQNKAAVEFSDVLVLCVKPQVLEQVIEPISSVIAERSPVVVSIAAGIEMNSLERWLGSDLPIVRCMPNTPAQVLEGASGLFANSHVSAQQKAVIEALFSVIGYATWVDQESLIHAVTALSGSGPAYIFLMIAEMAKTGEELGLDAHAAKRLAAQTVLGASKMVLQSELAPQQLKQNVMSPGGTTERAIGVFESEGLGSIVNKAMHSAATRSEELAALLGGK